MTPKTVNFLLPEQIESEEHFSNARLHNLKVDPKSFFPTDARPLSSFIQLMDWTLLNFKPALKDQENLMKFIHNRIVIDGEFLKFCDTNNITVKCLYQDSTVSWKTEHNYERFFVQGVFLIKSKDVEFIHAALFHKGNQNEDEISFFIVVSEKNVEKYFELRNNFDSWVSKRDRNNTRITVIGGENLFYDKNLTWNDVFLPDPTKSRIKKFVEDFLSSQDFYLSKKIAWKRGMLLYGNAGNGKSTIIRTIMSMYDLKPVTLVANASDDMVRDAFAYAEDHSPALLYFEDLDSLLEKSLDLSTFLNLMDGISAKNGILVVATANEIKKFKANIIDRPSRFDGKFEIPLPDLEMSQIYLKKWFKNSISAKKCKELAQFAVKHKFSYAYLKELYISSMFQSLSRDRKELREEDIKIALDNLIRDKNLLGGVGVSLDKYLEK